MVASSSLDPLVVLRSSQNKGPVLDTAQDPYNPVSVSLVLCPSELPHLHCSTLAPVPRTSCSSLLCPTAYFVQLAFTQPNSTPPPHPVQPPALYKAFPAPNHAATHSSLHTSGHLHHGNARAFGCPPSNSTAAIEHRNHSNTDTATDTYVMYAG